MKKRIVSMFLALALTASLAACGGGNGNEGASNGNQGSEAGAAGNDGSDAGSDAADGAGEADGVGEADGAGSSAGSGEAFKIGGIGPTTGGAALYGLAAQRGGQIAVDEINAAGGINGY